jgi:hypothetical protein
MTWGQYSYPFVPMVDKYKWLEPRHMVNISDRWNHDKTDNLQFAFFNGVGWESWENIWGIWNGITPRDAEATRRVATMERALAPISYQQRLGANVAHVALWRLCQPLAVGFAGRLDDCESQPDTTRKGRRLNSRRKTACAISIFIMVSNSRP